MDVLTVGRPLGDHDRLDMSEKPLAELMGGSMVSRTGIQAYGRGRAEVGAGLGGRAARRSVCEQQLWSG